VPSTLSSLSCYLKTKAMSGRTIAKAVTNSCVRRRRRPAISRRQGFFSSTIHRDIHTRSKRNADLNNSNSNDGIGTIEGVFLFHRHGDRTPARRLVADTYAIEETLYWQTKVPPGSSLYDSLSQLYPTDIHLSNNDGSFFDTRREPYGFLTWRGMEQMRLVGHRCAVRYATYGHQASKTVDANASTDDDGAIETRKTIGRSFLRYWNIEAYSTCYLRTVKSVQCFLHGLLGDDDQRSYEDYIGCENKQRTLRETIAEEAKRERPTSRPGEDLVGVEVRDRTIDTLNAFDRNPDLMKSLVTEVVDTDHFQKYDDQYGSSLARQLCDLLPGLLAPNQRRLFGGPSGINWIHAADHYVCRLSHGLNYARFSDMEHDGKVEAALRKLFRPTITHLAWRFRQWYKSPPLLAAIAAPPLREIEGQIRNAVEMDADDRRPFVVYSCHDVTILSLLYGLGADFLEDDNGEGWKFWPSYATTLVIELVRVKEGKGDPDDTHVLRLVLNDEPVSVVALRDKADKDQVLRISDFAAIIDRLEEAGGWGPNGRLADDPACASVTRDMSGWTG